MSIGPNDRTWIDVPRDDADFLVALVQGLTSAKMALELKDYERGLENVAKTLTSAQKIVTRLLSESGGVDPGDLVRSEPATLDEDQQDPG